MPIAFSCPHCGHYTNVADQYAGQTGPCTQCGQLVTVPYPGATPQPLPGVGPMKTPKTGKASSSATLLIVVAAVMGGMLLCGGILLALLLPAVQAAREAARRMACQNNLKQIGLAMHNYHDAYQTLPPAYIADENGRPMHSWRVLLLPFLQAGPTHEQYDFSKPWDSSENQALANVPIAAYHCPSSSEPNTQTSYMVIDGPGFIFDGTKATKFQDVHDGLSNTVLVVEVRGVGANWMEPKDLTAQDILTAGQGNSGLNSYHVRGMNILMADGSVRFLSGESASALLQQLATRAGGEAVMLP